MKPTRTLGILLLLLTLLLTGCSAESLMQKGAGLLDEIFAGDYVDPIVSTGEPETEPEPTTDPEPTVPGAEEPDILEENKPVVPDYSGSQSASEPTASVTAPEPSVTAPDASQTEITPSHTDVTFFGPGEFIHYLPKGVTGVYACDYTPGDDKVASVDSNTGKVTAVGPGTTKIKMHVESNGQYDFECIVRCNWTEDSKKDTGSSSKADEPVLPPEPSAPSAPSTPAPSTASSSSGVTASHSDVTFFNPKENFRFLPQGAGDDSSVSYSTSDSKVAEVDGKTGKVTAVGPGTATVTMTVDAGGTDYIFKCTVRCNW